MQGNSRLMTKEAASPLGTLTLPCLTPSTRCFSSLTSVSNPCHCSGCQHSPLLQPLNHKGQEPQPEDTRILTDMLLTRHVSWEGRNSKHGCQCHSKAQCREGKESGQLELGGTHPIVLESRAMGLGRRWHATSTNCRARFLGVTGTNSRQMSKTTSPFFLQAQLSGVSICENT